MLEIGAARPDWLSMGAIFRAKGWDVLSVEPNPEFAAMHRALGHDVAEVALSSEDRDQADFTVVDCNGTEYRDGRVTFESWSSLGIHGEFAEMAVPTSQRRISVRACRADTLLSEQRPNWDGIDLVAIDIEGWELDALSGLDFARFRPAVVIMENLFISSSYRRFMRERGYRLWRCSFPNEVYVRKHRITRFGHLWSFLLCEAQSAIPRSRLMISRILRRVRAAYAAGKRSPVNAMRT